MEGGRRVTPSRDVLPLCSSSAWMGDHALSPYRVKAAFSRLNASQRLVAWVAIFGCTRDAMLAALVRIYAQGWEIHISCDRRHDNWKKNFVGKNNAKLEAQMCSTSKSISSRRTLPRCRIWRSQKFGVYCNNCMVSINDPSDRRVFDRPEGLFRNKEKWLWKPSSLLLPVVSYIGCVIIIIIFVVLYFYVIIHFNKDLSSLSF